MKKLICLLAFGFIFGCDNYNVNFIGEYTGKLPCADCEGIDTRIVLEDNGMYKISQVYLGKDFKSDASGKYEFDKKKSIIKLDNMNGFYIVNKDSLEMVNDEGERATGEIASMYILRKTIK